MSDTVAIDPIKIHQWLSNQFDVKKIEEELRTLGFDADSIEAHVKEFNKVKYAKRQTNSFIYMTVGAVLGFISCVLALVNPFPELHEVFLYGLTSVSVIIVFIGLYYLFEG